MEARPRKKRFGGGGGPLRNRDVNEEAVARRFVTAKLTLAECGRLFGITPERVKRILDKQGIDPSRPPLDPQAVVSAYAQFNSVALAARVNDVSLEKAGEILDARGIQRNPRSRPPAPLKPYQHSVSQG